MVGKQEREGVRAVTCALRSREERDRLQLPELLPPLCHVDKGQADMQIWILSSIAQGLPCWSPLFDHKNTPSKSVEVTPL